MIKIKAMRKLDKNAPLEILYDSKSSKFPFLARGPPKKSKQIINGAVSENSVTTREELPIN